MRVPNFTVLLVQEVLGEDPERFLLNVYLFLRWLILEFRKEIAQENGQEGLEALFKWPFSSGEAILLLPTTGKRE